MPELPDITVYVEHLTRLLEGEALRKVRLGSPFVLRSVTPPLAGIEGKRVRDFRRLGKRIVFAFEEDLFLVLHLMIAGRLKWRPADPNAGAARKASEQKGAGNPRDGFPIPKKLGLAAFDFDAGTLLLTEAGSKKRAWMRLVKGVEALAALDPGGLEPLEADRAAFGTALTMENHTLKRALTDPRLFSGIGNAYSDEILHRARLSPVALTRKLTEDQISRLHEATRTALLDWTELLRKESADAFPEKVTAFREGMAVHGKYGQPCPVCGTPVQRIVYADNETNYCPFCQTGGKLLADRSLSRLLKGDWPKSLEDMEEMTSARRAGSR